MVPSAGGSHGCSANPVPISRSSASSVVSMAMLYLDLPEFSRLYPLQGRPNVFYSQQHIGPPVGTQYDDRHSPAAKVLLIPHTLVGGDQELVFFALSLVQQLTVAQFRPTSFGGCVNGMFRDIVA